ncbi:DUF3857 domain-containing transglutaminase family protein [Mucilaginibacter ginsenosidivorax]|uniref:DUF3857 domain-containing protein n=1 Tax=Mucilaginibacter ginsenosidivorax TaxID=862126 RepID=A0A5B8VZJ7_9SPHI|nr:DUF3857 and transglutaminase domain-containing protein [Mucilaginibacter ginsenosidivorax]QEC76944.1 DUF3857 domain-containing protein [Mucilaginibacter ginsenosidivorax]
MLIKHYTRLLLTTAALCALYAPGYSQDKNIPKELYVATTIPDSLKEDANSVVRYSLEDCNIKGPGKAEKQYHSIVTILNEKGNGEAGFGIEYNKKFNSVNSFEMKVYDAAGTLIKKYHKSDMYDHLAVDNETLVTEDRVLQIRHTISSYPCTIEIIYAEDSKSSIDLGAWYIQGFDQSVQNTSYHISISADAGFRYSNKNTNIKPQKSTLEKTDSYTWQVTNLKAIKPEDGSESWRVLPKVYFAANDFEYYGIPGNISSWQNYGKWQQSLNSDICSLSPKRVQEIQTMTANIKTDKEKVRFLYNYLQKNVRYVGVQLGIGGLKPFPASFVDEKKYGDCKGLSNYMCAMLKAVDIPAYYAKVRAGTNEEPCNPAFPNDLSNHIIVCVPLKNDTTWLECTSQTQQFGKLGKFTENRNALVITENGGKLVNTPKSAAIDNQLNAEAHVVLDADGGSKAHLKILSTGDYRDDYISIEALKTDEQKQAVITMLNMKQPSELIFKPSTDGDGVKEVNIDLVYDKFCDITSGDKHFYKPRVFDLWQATLPVEEKRKSDYYFDVPMLKSCVTTIDLPAGFEVETLPASQSLKFSYGTYDVKYTYDAIKNQVVNTTKFNLTNQVIPAAKYNEMQTYFDAIAKAQNKKLVIRRKA